MSKSDARDEALMLALLTNPNYAQAADTAGVSLQTLRNRVFDPEFQRQLKDRRLQIMDALAMKIIEKVELGLEALARNCVCGKPDIEVKAATQLVLLGEKMQRLNFEKQQWESAREVATGSRLLEGAFQDEED